MPKTKNEQTSKNIGTKASEALRDPKASAREKSLAASALTQRPDKAKAKGNK
jgi:hypothetical protein